MGVNMENRKLCGALGAAAVATTGLLMSAGSIFADPPSTLTSPPFHRHFLVLPDGTQRAGGPEPLRASRVAAGVQRVPLQHPSLGKSSRQLASGRSARKAERQDCTTDTVPKSSAFEVARNYRVKPQPRRVG